MSKLDKDQVIAAFSEAYTKANGKAPSIEAKGGWYSVDGAKNVRLSELNDQISALSNDTPQTKPAVAETSAKATKKPAVKKAAPKKAKAKKSDFSVKAFWADKITNDNSGSTLPR